MADADDAHDLARALLALADPRRWRHVQAVASEAERFARVMGVDLGPLVAAAYLHDIGYSPDLVSSGFHPLDGARYLRTMGASDRLCSLVAHHSGALIEAELRGLREVLAAEFEDERSATRDALWYCDMTTGPDGQRMTLDERLAEIEGRYGAGHVVTRFAELARPELAAAVSRTELLLASVP